MKFFKLLKSLSLFLLLFSFLGIGTEFFWALLTHPKAPLYLPELVFQTPFFQPEKDPYIYPPSKVECHGKVCFDLWHRRESPKKKRPRSRPLHLVVAGGSFVYGEGLNNKETLPVNLEKNLPHYQVYNYGRSGGSPAHFLARLIESPIRSSEIPEKNGISLFVLITHHLYRIAGTMNYLRWNRDPPYFDLDRNSALFYGKTFRTSKPWSTFFKQLLGQSLIFRERHFIDPLAQNSKYFELTCKILLETKKRLLHQLNTHFAVMLYPGEKELSRIVPCLQQNKVPVLDFTHQKRDRGDGNPPEKWHPSASENKLMAQKITSELEALDWIH